MATPAATLPQRARPRLPSRPSLRPVPRPAARARRLPFALLSVAVVAGLLLVLVSAQALVAQGSFRVSQLERQANELRLEHQELRLRVAKLSSPERVSAAAGEAGLVPGGPVEVLEGP